MGNVGSGRKIQYNTKRWVDYFDKATDLTFRAAARLIKDESVPLTERVRICLPLALKRVPSQTQVTQLTINASPELLAKTLEIAERNARIYERLQNAPESIVNDAVLIAPAQNSAISNLEP